MVIIGVILGNKRRTAKLIEVEGMQGKRGMGVLWWWVWWCGEENTYTRDDVGGRGRDAY